MHVTRVRVRFPETDKMGVVYHGHFFPYFELGRTELLRARGMPYTDVEKEGYRLVVVEASARFRAPAYYDQELEVWTRIEELSGASVVFRYEVVHEGTPIVEGMTRHACLGPDGRPTRLPVKVLEVLKNADNP